MEQAFRGDESRPAWDDAKLTGLHYQTWQVRHTSGWRYLRGNSEQNSPTQARPCPKRQNRTTSAKIFDKTPVFYAARKTPPQNLDQSICQTAARHTKFGSNLNPAQLCVHCRRPCPIVDAFH